MLRRTLLVFALMASLFAVGPLARGEGDVLWDPSSGTVIVGQREVKDVQPKADNVNVKYDATPRDPSPSRSGS